MRFGYTGALFMLATSACASVRYSPYAGGGPVHEATGGTSFSRNGIDWWTSGAPDRRFAVVGWITDDRDRLLLSGRAMGSREVADLVLRHGGDAVLLLQSTDRPFRILGKDYLFSGPSAFERRSHYVGTERRTRLAVISYL